MRVPSNSPITLPFGATTAPYTIVAPHNGTDFAYIPDDVIYAPFAGKVTQMPLNGNDGNGSYMTEPNGRFHGMLHASKYLVANGTVVTEGQPIAIMGDTGYAFGVHLHWCVKQNNVFIDPMSLVKGDEEVSEVGEVEFNDLYIAMFGPMETNPPTDDDRKRWIGAETNTVIRSMEADPRRASWLQYIQDLKNAASPTTVTLEPGVLYEVKGKE